MINAQPISTINTAITEEYLQTRTESQYFERKGVNSRATKVADEIIGMLNADGGVLALGVSDTGEIQDLKTLTAANLNKFHTLAIDFIHPACDVEIEEIIIDNKLIFLYHIEQDYERLYSRKDNEAVFLRVLDENRKLDRDGVTKLEYDRTIRKFEEEFVAEFDFEDLDDDILEQYKQNLNYQGGSLDLLTKRHLAKKQGDSYLLKNSAVLLFSKDPEKYIPTASVRYIRYEGKEALPGREFNVVKDERFENNIIRLISLLKTFLKTSFKDYYFLDLEEGKFKKIPEYPEDAWLEGLVNALCHRSYNIQGGSIYIKHFDDKLEISNSGPLPNQVTVENIKSERFSRNPRIAKVLEDMGYVRQLNEGVSRIYRSMEDSMLSTPEYKERNSNVSLTLGNKVSEHSRTIDNKIIQTIEDNWDIYNFTQKNILLYLLLNQRCTKNELATHCGTHINTISKHLNLFIKQNIVERRSEKQRDPDAIYIFKQL